MEKSGKGWRAWWPEGATPPRHTVVYLHGYHDTIDSCWEKHKLVEQFVAGGRNALHLVPGTPSTAVEEVTWPALDELLRAVGQPVEPTAVIAHSGGYRTAWRWLEGTNRPTVAYAGLIDALYSGVSRFIYWLERNPGVRLDMVTAQRGMPRQNGNTLLGLLTTATAARANLTVMQLSHMELVTKATVIPSMLQATGLPAAAQ